MLRNGALFSGKISESGGRYSVQLDAKTQMSFDPSRVWVVADSVGEICEFNRARTRPGDTAAQIEFARWCMTNKLLDEAQRELDTMKTRGVPEAQLKSLATALAAAQQGPAPAGGTPTTSQKLPRPTSLPSATVVAAPSGSMTSSLPSRPSTSPTTSISGPPSIALNRDQDQDFESAPKLNNPSGSDYPIAATDSTSPRGEMEQARPIVNSVFSFYDQPGFQNDERVQEAIEGRVQQTAVDQFNESVHWTLVQACAGCHYPENERLAQASSFTLEIPSSKHKATLEQTRHNLEQFLSLINRENPGNSRLLTLLSQPHGALKDAPLSVESEDYRLVTQWIFRSGIGNSGRELESRNMQATAETPDNVPALMSDVNPSSEKFQLPNLVPGSLGPDVDPTRPYDPEPFNRLYHPNHEPNVASPVREPSGTKPEVSSQPDTPTSSGRIKPPSGIPRIRRESVLPLRAAPTGNGSR